MSGPELTTVPTGAQAEAQAQRLYDQASKSRWRSDGERDRDRILYSSALQRLGHVTQVTAPEPGFGFHTRLTHTLKVAQLARRSAERLQRQAVASPHESDLDATSRALVAHLDADVAEAAALAHDLGHPPFGHLAETELDRLAAPAGGFEGNAQSFRILTRLAVRSQSLGLGLTLRTLNASLKYPWLKATEGDGKRTKKYGAYGSDEEAFSIVRKPVASRGDERCLEAILMDWADDITYAVHDLDDFFRAGLIPLDRLTREDAELDTFRRRLETEGRLGPNDPSAGELTDALADLLYEFVAIGEPYDGSHAHRFALRSTGSMLISRYVEALTLRGRPKRQVEICISREKVLEVKALQQLTWLYVIQRPSMAVIQRGQRRIVSDLWEFYFEAAKTEPRVFPPGYRERLDDQSRPSRARLAADVIASLTEQAARSIHARAFGYGAGSLRDGSL